MAHVRRARAEDETSQKVSEQQFLPSGAPQEGETFPDLSHLALRLIAELGACVQMVSGDLAQASTQVGDAADLEAARQRWARQLRALADMVELAEGEYAAAPPSELPLSALPPYPRRNRATQPITVATRIPVASPNEPAEQTSETMPPMPINPPLPATYRWVPLTAREREVLKLTQRGYPPRRIASRLIIEVETVYTHLRNIRRKQREWERAHQERQIQQAQQAILAPAARGAR